MRRFLCVVCIAVVLVAPALAAKGPVKVFILAGQSNMEGKATPSTLEAAMDDARLQRLKKDGKWVVRDDVHVTFLCKNVKGPSEGMELHGPLTIGFGSQKTVRDKDGKKVPVQAVGPELGFGHVVGDHFDEPVLLIKAAWGGKSVKTHFLPPSAGGPGDYYTKTLDEVRKVLGDIGKYVPSYDRAKGYEIAGLVWFQGWNDGVGKGNPDYTEQLAHFIRDIRKDLKAPGMPVVIGEMGVDGDKPIGWIATFRKQQAAVAALPEFKDNVRLARTAEFWPPWYKPLDDTWRAFKAKERAWRDELKAAGKTPTRDEISAFGDKHWRTPNRNTIARMSDKRYHYMGCGRTIYLMGEAFGKAMLDMMK